MALVHYAPGSPPAGLRDHVLRTLQLALPVIVARCGLLVLIAVDTAMTGHAGAGELAAYGLSMAPQVPMLLLGIGMLMGTVVLTSQAVGAGRESDCGHVLTGGLRLAGGVGVLVLVLCFLGEPFLLLTGQADDLARRGGGVLEMFGYGMPGLFLYTAVVFFLEGINRPKPGMVVMVLANLLNAALNWLLVYGNAGLPAMGAEGAALATTLVRWFMFAAILGYVLVAVDRERFGLTVAQLERRRHDRLGPRLRRIGFPMSLAMVVESGAFSAMLLFAGHLGEVEVAAYQLTVNLCALTFMTAIGFGTAASVRVGNAVGRGDPTGMRFAGWTAVGLAACLLAALGLLIGNARELLASVYTSDAAVLSAALPAIAVAAVSIVPDGIQGTIMGALRGAADAWPATLLYIFSFWLVMVPLGYWLGVVREGGASGLMAAVLVAGVIAMACLAARFVVVSRRTVARA